jgi:hypothetical protein
MTPEDPVLLLVEGQSDVEIVRSLCDAANYPSERVRLIGMGGKRNIETLVKSIPAGEASRYAVLIDLDEVGVADAIASARRQLGHPAVEVFCAVPEIEAWLFADDRLARKHATSDDARRILEHIPLPEAIPRPRELARQLFGPPKNWGFLRDIDLEYAAARSPSLRSFLVGLGRLLQLEREPIVESVGRTIDRDVIASLISEILPSDTVVWRTTSGEYTAGELRQHIESGTEIGRRYAMDLLRISRDYLLRKAARTAAT